MGKHDKPNLFGILVLAILAIVFLIIVGRVSTKLLISDGTDQISDKMFVKSVRFNVNVVHLDNPIARLFTPRFKIVSLEFDPACRETVSSDLFGSDRYKAIIQTYTLFGLKSEILYIHCGNSGITPLESWER